MQKRAQITAFVIMGIVVLAAVGFLVYLKKTPAEEAVPPSMAHVKIFVEQCLRQTAENAVFLAGLQGGYIYFDDVDSYETFYSETYYWYQAGYNFAPKNEAVGGQIDRYIEEQLNAKCLHDFSPLQSDVTSGEMDVKTTITPERVVVELDMPVTLDEGGVLTTISKFSADVDAGLGTALDVGREIIDMEMKDPSVIDLNYLAGLELPVTISQPENNVVIYMVTDADSDVLGLPFRLIFANKISKEVETENTNPKIDPIDDITVNVGETVRVQASATDPDGDGLTFSMISGFAEITSEGLMTISPTEIDRGENYLMIEVSDGKDGFDSEDIKVTVK